MGNILKDKLQAIQNLINQQQRPSEDLYKVNDKVNDNTLDLKGCKICNGIGLILRQENGATYSRECECFKKKLSQERFSKTEISNKTNTHLKIIKLMKNGKRTY